MGKGRRWSGESEQERRDRAVEMAIDLMYQSTITLYKFILYMGTFMA